MYFTLSYNQAIAIGEFEYGDNMKFSPFTSFVNGKYFVSMDLYNLLKDTDQFKNVDFTNVDTCDSLPTPENFITQLKNG